MSLAPAGGGALQTSTNSLRLQLADPLYVGLAVCAHNDQRLEQVRFSGVELLRQKNR